MYPLRNHHFRFGILKPLFFFFPHSSLTLHIAREAARSAAGGNWRVARRQVAQRQVAGRQVGWPIKAVWPKKGLQNTESKRMISERVHLSKKKHNLGGEAEELKSV